MIPEWVPTILSGASIIATVVLVAVLVSCAVHVTTGDRARAMPAAVLGGACALGLGGLIVAVVLG